MHISVYITSFNKARFLSKAIRSVLNQTYNANEIIIVDDCSIDDSREIIEGFHMQYPNLIKPVFNEKNFGISKARNIAISNCNNELVTFVDADDYFLPNKLENEFNLISKSNYDCIYSNHVFVDVNDKKISYFSTNKDIPAQGNIFIENYTRFFSVSSGANFHNEMFYKKHAIEIGLYDENIKIWEDWDFRIRMSKEKQYGYSPQVNSSYRVYEEGLHHSAPDIHYREQIKIYNKNQVLIKDLPYEDQLLIHNRVYSKIKASFFDILNSNKFKRNIFLNIYYCISFILNFRTRKSISFAIRTLLKFN